MLITQSNSAENVIEKIPRVFSLGYQILMTSSSSDAKHFIYRS